MTCARSILRLSALGLSDHVTGIGRCMGGRMLFLTVHSLAMWVLHLECPMSESAALPHRTDEFENIGTCALMSLRDINPGRMSQFVLHQSNRSRFALAENARSAD